MESNQEQSQLATLRRFYQAETEYLLAEAPDFSEIAGTLHPDCVLYQPASLPYGGEWHGHAGVEAWMKAFSQQWASLEATDPEMFCLGDVVVSKSHVHATTRSTGRQVDWPLLQFFRFREARIAQLYPFHWDTAAMLRAMQINT